jgi:hypothetical protein
MIIIDDIEQGSDAWFREKAGKPGASSFDRIVTTKGEPSKSRTDYLYQLAGEAMIGRQEEGYTNFAMQQGVERESESRALFEMLQGVTIRKVGLVYRDEGRAVLCSPDGLLDGCGLEMKNPLLKTHVKYLLNGTLPTDYFQQVHGSMYVTGFDRWFFMSNYPGLPPFIIEVKRDKRFIEKLSVEMDKFVYDLAALVAKLRGMV